MVMSLLKGLAEEKIVFLESPKAFKSLFPLEGIVRVVDKKGNTLALVLDKQTLEELEEEIEATNPDFLASLDASRKSGRVPGNAVKKKAGLR